MPEKNINLAILGATGAVGREMLKIVHEKSLPYHQIKLLASPDSAGKTLNISNRTFTVQETCPHSFDNVDVCLASAGSAVSRKWLPVIIKAGSFLIDNSSAFRMDDDVPLVVPEVNPHTIKKSSRIIGNPNCSTIQLVQVLFPLHKIFRLKKVIISTYQAVSGAGNKGISELQEQIKAMLAQQQPQVRFFPRQIAANVIPHIDYFTDNGYTAEEMKMILETRKILAEPELQITSTCVRVPVIHGHSEAVLLEFEQPVTPRQIKDILSETPNLQVMDDPASLIYPTPLDIIDNDNTLVGRIRQDILGKNWISLWIVSNNLRKGAALNAVQIAEYLIKNNLL